MFATHFPLRQTTTRRAATFWGIGLMAAWLLLFTPDTKAEAETFGDYRVHYSVFNSTFIDPDIAAAYDLVRAKDLALINISVTRHQDGEVTYGVPARVTGQATNLIQQGKALEFQEIAEGDAIYYLAAMSHTHEENFNFRIRVKPDAQNKPYELQFSRKLYVEGR